jgi:hypothetical protein
MRVSDLFGVAGRVLLERVTLDPGYRGRVNSLLRLIDAFSFEIAAVSDPADRRVGPRAQLSGAAGPCPGSGRCWPRCSSPRSATCTTSPPRPTTLVPASPADHPVPHLDHLHSSWDVGQAVGQETRSPRCLSALGAVWRAVGAGRARWALSRHPRNAYVVGSIPTGRHHRQDTTGGSLLPKLGSS